MTKSFKDLTSDQLARFTATCQHFGIDPGSVPAQVDTAKVKDGVLCGHPSGSAEFPVSKIHDVNTIAELNALGGCKDDSYTKGVASDSFVSYPPSAASLGLPSLAACGGDVCKLKDSMTLDQHEAVAKAMNAYLMGNSAKVSDYEEHINAIHFPMQVVSHAAQNIVIGPNNPLIINNPSGAPTNVVAGTITVQRGGYILVKTPLSMNSQIFTVQK